MTLVVLGGALPLTSTMSLFFNVDLLVSNRISSLLVNMEVAIGDDSYFKTGRLLTNDAWINQVGVVHLKANMWTISSNTHQLHYIPKHYYWEE